MASLEAAPSSPAAAAATPAATLAAESALCRPAESGSLRARVQGSIDAEIAWSAPEVPQCLGGPRPAGDGVRLVYKGNSGGESLLVIVGIALDRADTASRQAPANVTVVREGAGEFYATQGDDKCALDEVRQVPIDDVPGRYRLVGRGYCTQPARALAANGGSVLVSRFDVEAIIEYPRES